MTANHFTGKCCQPVPTAIIDYFFTISNYITIMLQNAHFSLEVKYKANVSNLDRNVDFIDCSKIISGDNFSKPDIYLLLYNVMDTCLVA